MLARRHPILTALLVLTLGAVVYAQTVPARKAFDAAPRLRYDVRVEPPSALLREIRALHQEVRRLRQ